MDKVYYIWLILVFGPHNVKSVELYLKYKDAKQIYDAVISGKVELTPSEKKRLSATKLSKAEDILKWCDENSVEVVTIADKGYPKRLASIYNPPVLLFVMGSLECIDDNVCVAVVGTRHPSEYSVNVAGQICSNLSKLGVVIVSGFAVGIDSVAHGCALRERQRTVAVLGSGIDYDYPKENAKLKRIIAKHGAVISEYLPSTQPRRENFPERNRIISGLSLGVLVVEAETTSGSLITAEHALQQGRDVFCVPPANIFDRRYTGVIKYIRDGATPVFSHLDIVYTYFDDITDKINSDNIYGDYSLDLENQLSKNSKKASKAESRQNKAENESKKEKNAPKKEIDLSEYDEIQVAILKALQESDLIADEIANKTNIPIDEILSSLTELEIFGVIKLTEGQRYKVI